MYDDGAVFPAEIASHINTTRSATGDTDTITRQQVSNTLKKLRLRGGMFNDIITDSNRNTLFYAKKTLILYYCIILP